MAGASSEGLAQRSAWKLGDRMGFDIAGTVVEGRITSLRRVDWGSMRVNFFVMFPRADMPELPATCHLGTLRAPARAGIRRPAGATFPTDRGRCVAADRAGAEGAGSG